MKQKTKRILSNTLLLSGISLYTIQVLYLISKGINRDPTMVKIALFNVILIISLVSGYFLQRRSK